MSPGCDPTSEANESRALEGSFLTPEFRSRNDHLLNFVRSSLAELVDVQLGFHIGVARKIWRQLLDTTGMSGTY